MRPSSVVLGFVVFAFACRSVTRARHRRATFAYDFSTGAQGWTSGSVGLRHPDRTGARLVADWRPLPAPLDQTSQRAVPSPEQPQRRPVHVHKEAGRWPIPWTCVRGVRYGGNRHKHPTRMLRPRRCARRERVRESWCIESRADACPSGHGLRHEHLKGQPSDERVGRGRHRQHGQLTLVRSCSGGGILNQWELKHLASAPDAVRVQPASDRSVLLLIGVDLAR